MKTLRSEAGVEFGFVEYRVAKDPMLVLKN